MTKLKIWNEVSLVLPEFISSSIPNLNELKKYFELSQIYSWKSDASITYRSNDETCRLTIIPNEDNGVWLQYECLDDHYFSLGDRTLLNEYAELTDDVFTISGLFVSPELAWLSVKVFLETEGTRATQVNWISKNQLPKGMHWSIASFLIDDA